MFVNSIILKKFRNHHYLNFDFTPGINIFVGCNAAGKTNVAEAIYYLSLAKSFRTTEDIELIEKGQEEAEIDANVSEGKIVRKLKIIITKQGRKVFINGKPILRLSELSKTTNVVLFEPKDVMLFKGSPKERRNFLDISISKKCLPYLDYINKYDKVLRERNELLKKETVDENLLDSTTEMLVKLSGPIVSYRQMYVKDINDILNKITRALTGADDEFKINYKPFVNYDSEFKNNALLAFKRAKESDLHRKVTTIGVHREDFSISLNGRDIGVFGSQGENRIAALALKLSPYFLIEDKDKRPVIVLDDVMSELDINNQNRLIAFLKKFDQVFITATKLEISGSNHLEIKKKTKEVF